MTAHVLMGHPLSRAGAAHLESGQAFRHRDTQSDGKNSQFWSLVAFPETAQSELLRLNAGDSVSVHGALKAKTYKKMGVKVADWAKTPRANIIFVHGLGGHAYDTWRRAPDDNSFWPLWLAEDVEGISVWTLAYAAPASNCRKQSRASASVVAGASSSSSSSAGERVLTV